MKTFDLKSLIIGVLLGTMVAVFTFVATTNVTPQGWEYRVVDGYKGDDYQKKINEAAQDGWEVVGVANDPERRPFAVMKRAKAVRRTWMFWKK